MSADADAADRVLRVPRHGLPGQAGRGPLHLQLRLRHLGPLHQLPGGVRQVRSLLICYTHVNTTL